ncbi:MAG: hypothetical protein F6K24_39735 [Okeania sp. SIO2D1]|nr:hypothetical protein [Okeania sp. SIO2D1]
MKFRLTLSIGLNGKQEVVVSLKQMGYTLKRWNKLSEEEKESILIDEAQERLMEYIEYGYEELKNE